MAEKTIDQCPSTRGKREVDRAPRKLAETAGRPVWRSVDEFVDKPDFREWLGREFPARASELLEGSRRDFLKVMGASLALAGAATIPGCRRPEHTIMPYSREVPEDQVPGRMKYYATAMPQPGGGAEGLLVETHEGRPTKIEGNPLHPMNQGRSTVWSQAAVLDLYDPFRLMQVVYDNPARGPIEATWDDFGVWARGDDGFTRYDANGGRGLAFVVGKQSSPSRDAMRDAVLRRWPNARWVAYEPLDNPVAVEASRLAFGQPVAEELRLENAKRIVLVERDPAYGENEQLRNARGLVAQRAPMTAKDDHGDPIDMSRIYSVEGSLSVSGGKADHRMRLAPSLQPAFVVALAKALMRQLGGDPAIQSALAGVQVPSGITLNQVWVDECAADLAAHRGESIVLVGASLPLGIHALAHAMNAALGAVGPVVRYRPMPADIAANGMANLVALSAAMDAGQVSTVVCLNTNPVYDAPAEANFPLSFAKVPVRVTLSIYDTETAAASTWRLNGTHFLEQWGDVTAADGTLSVVQPIIAPLYFGKSEIELLAFLAGESFEEEARLTHLEESARKQGAVVVDGQDGPTRVGNADDVFPEDAAVESAEGVEGGLGLPKWPDGHHIVRAVWRGVMRDRFGVAARGEFEKRWRRALHDGLVANSAQPALSPDANLSSLANAIGTIRVGAAPAAGSLDVLFTPGRTLDGRYAGNAWLQELPDIASTTTWDNPALISPGTARNMGLVPGGDNPRHVYLREHTTGKMVRLNVGGRTLELPVWICPGLADDTIVLRLGYGRMRGGDIAQGAGFDTYKLRSAGQYAAAGVEMERVPGDYWIASTQNHWSLEGRTEIVRRVELPAWQKFGDHVEIHDDEYQLAESELNFAEQLGTVSHAPPNRSIYVNPYNDSKTDAAPGSVYSQAPQWGMTIDMASCIGCGVCTIACQSENNIPVVGKQEVAKGREMTWIRVDRYFVGELNDPEEILHQPFACVHCENAPCETVCPVNATVHGPEGHNYMVYNRCIGTRYCANNCPYKVRRFNFFDYGVKRLEGGLNEEATRATNGFFEDKLPPNQHFIPPRLRAKLTEIEKMQKNPNVTIRSRGVMEKCTYCIQRTNNAKIETKLRGLESIPEGFVQTACQQACPTGAIVFGDILDPDSAVARTRDSGRSYAVLGYLNTRPRTTHLMAVYNPNPEILKNGDKNDKKRYEHLDWHPHDVKNEKMGLPLHYQDGHGGGHGDEHGEPHAQGTSFFDLHRREEDTGYALSLKVLKGGLSQGGLL